MISPSQQLGRFDMRRSIALGAFLSVLGLIGCNSGPVVTSGGSRGSGSSGSGTSNGTGTGGNQPYYGSIVLSTNESSTNFTASAALYLRAGSPLSSCSGTQSGSCCYSPAGSDATTTLFGAGTITLTDKGSQLGQLFYNDAGYGELNSEVQVERTFFWSAGDTIDVSAAGGAVQAFSGSAVAPAAITGFSPMPGATTLSVTGANGLNITWTPGSGSDSFVLFLRDATANSITCEVPITAGTLSVPSSLLVHLSGSGFIQAYPQASSNFDGPNANVALLIGGSGMFGMASFQ
jgi:hypothetical protein